MESRGQGVVQTSKKSFKHYKEFYMFYFSSSLLFFNMLEEAVNIQADKSTV